MRFGLERPVCRCNGVTRERIEIAVHSGATSVEDIIRRTRATTGCGTCFNDVVAAFRDARLKVNAAREGQILLPFVRL
jgi:NAD(P)H-nitrite reductase large subunit